jgi:hypothetical protein
LPGLNADGYINALTVDAADNIYVGGAFYNSSVNNYVAKWNGLSWSELGSGLDSLKANNYIFTLHNDAQGNIYVAGAFRNNANKNYVAKWDGNNWSEVGGLNSLTANDDILTIATDNTGSIYCAGYFTNANNEYYVAKHTTAPNAITKIEKTNTLTAFPNPFTNQLNITDFIKTTQPTHIEVWDALGQKIYEEHQPAANIHLQTANWHPGVYIILVQQIDASIQTIRTFKRTKQTYAMISCIIIISPTVFTSTSGELNYLPTSKSTH